MPDHGTHSADDVDINAYPRREMPSPAVVAAYVNPERPGRGAHRDEDPPEIQAAEYRRDFPQVMSNAECNARNWHYPMDWRFDDE